MKALPEIRLVKFSYPDGTVYDTYNLASFQCGITSKSTNSTRQETLVKVSWFSVTVLFNSSFVEYK